jgi:hypothetical protein
MLLTTHLSKTYDRLVNEFVKFLCDELVIMPSHVSIIGYDLEENYGVCFDDDDGVFTILVKEKDRDISQVFTTIAHEMIHVKQYMTQELGRLLDEQSHVPYEQRWWELEAFEKSVPLVEKFAKNITSRR